MLSCFYSLTLSVFSSLSICLCWPKVFTLYSASWCHAGLEILSVWTWHSQVQLCLQHPLSHLSTFLTSSTATCRPRRPLRVNACLWYVILKEKQNKIKDVYSFSTLFHSPPPTHPKKNPKNIYNTISQSSPQVPFDRKWGTPGISCKLIAVLQVLMSSF